MCIVTYIPPMSYTVSHENHSRIKNDFTICV